MPPSKREELVDAAMRLFHQHGFQASGLERLLKAAGISRMTIYNHFASKDELILAALRRRDEIFRNGMMRHVNAQGGTASQRLLAVFDYHERWFAQYDFSGCMFINAAAEFSDPRSAARQVTAEHKRAVVRYLAELCREEGLAEPEEVAEELALLIEGAVVMTHTVELAHADRQAGAKGTAVGDAGRRARAMAARIIDSAARAQRV